jgi:hypothetical protein
VEGKHPGILRVSHSEYRDLDPVWKETDRAGLEKPDSDLSGALLYTNDSEKGEQQP